MIKEELKQQLIELIEEAKANLFKHVGRLDGGVSVCIADHLVANGVTIRERGEWVLEHGDYGKMICSSCKGQCPTEKKPDPYEDFQITDFYVESDFCPHCGADLRGENDVKCKDCEYLMFSDMYGECSKAYKGIVYPWDSCGKGKKKGGAE